MKTVLKVLELNNCTRANVLLSGFMYWESGQSWFSEQNLIFMTSPLTLNPLCLHSLLFPTSYDYINVNSFSSISYCNNSELVSKTYAE